MTETVTAKPKSLPTVQIPIAPAKHASGFCAPGAPETSHNHCRGAFRNGSSAKIKILTCPCPHHEGQPLICLDCGTPGQPGEIHETTRVCLDRAECEAQRQAKVEADPMIRQIRQAQEHAAERREEAGIPTKPVRVRAATPERPTTGTCHCCGEATKGGLFVAGHDARLKGVLKKAAATGDAWAWAEATARANTKSEAWRPKGESPEGAALLAEHGDEGTIALAVQRRLNPEG